MKQQDPKPSEGERVARALESVAGSLERLTNPPLIAGSDPGDAPSSIVPGPMRFVRSPARLGHIAFDSPHKFRIQAFTGWRWRVDDDGMLLHEPLPEALKEPS